MQGPPIPIAGAYILVEDGGIPSDFGIRNWPIWERI